jgi:hypothetical protein
LLRFKRNCPAFTLFSTSAWILNYPDFINTPDAIKILDRSIELHTDFTKAFGLIDSIFRRYVHFTTDYKKAKRKGKMTGLDDARTLFSRSTKERPRGSRSPN